MMLRLKQRYHIREERTGWTVYDIWTGEPVALALSVQSGLSFSEAQDLTELLNRPEATTRKLLQ
jgi:hypothetical protein